MLKKQFTNTSRLLLRLHSTNFKLISNLVSNFLYIENDMDQVDKVTHQVDSVSLMLLVVSNIFICLSSHDCTLIIDVAIYFILIFFYCEFYCEYKKWKKSSSRELMHMLCMHLEILGAWSFLFQSLTGNIVSSCDCSAQIWNSPICTVNFLPVI